MPSPSVAGTRVVCGIVPPHRSPVDQTHTAKARHASSVRIDGRFLPNRDVFVGYSKG